MSENRFWNLLAKKLSGEALPGEVLELEDLMKAHPEWVFSAEHIESLWKLQPKDTPYDAELAFELHLLRQKKNGLYLPELQTPALPGAFDPPPARSGKKWMPAALLAVLLLLLAG